MELLLSACATYDKLHNNARQSGQLTVYASNVDYNHEASYKDYTMEVFHVDTDLEDIMTYSTSTSYPSNRTAFSSNGASPFLPREEQHKLSSEKKKEILAKRRKERDYSNENSNSPQVARRVNVHDIQDTVNLDNIIEYTAMRYTYSRSRAIASGSIRVHTCLS